jgi:chromosome segregation ATPase
LGFLKKDVNLKLISIILVLVIAITAFTILYDNRLENILTGYKNKAELLEAITAKAVSQEAEAYEISQSKETIQKDKEALEKNYNTINNENRALKKGLETLKTELQKTKSELTDKTEKFNLLQKRFYQVEGSLINANEELSRLSVKVNSLCDALESAGGDYEGC